VQFEHRHHRRAGHLGGALAKRLAKAGYAIVIGARAAEKAEAAGEALTSRLIFINKTYCVDGALKEI